MQNAALQASRQRANDLTTHQTKLELQNEGLRETQVALQEAHKDRVTQRRGDPVTY